jgi:hypothetical protein
MIQATPEQTGLVFNPKLQRCFKLAVLDVLSTFKRLELSH